MIYRMIVNVGLFALGYYLGREVGRTEGVREQLRQAREGGGSVYLGEAEVIQREKTAANRTEAHGSKST